MESLRHRTPSETTVQLFSDLFRRGHSPSTALNMHMFDLQEEYQEEFFKVQADGVICPKLNWCYHLYYKEFQKQYGAPDGEEMISALQDIMARYNQTCGTICAKMKRKDSDIIVAICSPLMKRIHQNLPSCGEIGFMDAGGTMDRHNCRVFLLLAPSIAGGLPMGIIISASETEVVITEALGILQDILPEKAFFGRGRDMGPRIIITDDSSSERNSLRAAFVNVTLLLCIFHVLQAVWRYVWDGSHGVPMGHRSEIFHLFRNMLFAKDEETFHSLYEEALCNTTLCKYPIVETYFKQMESRAKDWALCYRNNLLTRGHRTDNLSEANIRVLKDQILERTKAFNMVQLFDFLTVKIDLFYQRRICSVLNNRMTNVAESRYHISEDKLKPLTAKKISDQVYEVKNSQYGGCYTVNSEIETCTCPIGWNGSPCKHQFLVTKEFGISSNQFLQCDAATKMRLHYIMSGSTSEVPDGWYSSLKLDSTPLSNIQLDIAAKQNKNDDTELDTTFSVLSTSDHAIQECLQEWEHHSEQLAKKIQERPDVFVPAMKKFMKSLSESSSSESKVVSALHTFGTPIGTVPASVRRGRTIPVNNHAVARRQVYLDGRKKQHTGRLAKTFRAHEHGYNKQAKRNAEPCWDKPPKKTKAAPHSLSQCVTMGTSLGKNHSKK